METTGDYIPGNKEIKDPNTLNTYIEGMKIDKTIGEVKKTIRDTMDLPDGKTYTF